MKTTILLNGEQHTLMFNNYAIEELGRQFGTDPMQMFKTLFERMKHRPLRVMSKLIYTGLVGYYEIKDKDCPFTTEQVAEWVGDADNADLARVFNIWVDATKLRSLLPDKPSDETEEKKRTGKKSKTTRSAK